jgi:uncharacterized membrane protein
MAVTREIDDITRSLVKHQHDHPPVRDLNRESDRRVKFPQRVADDLGRVVGSWTFVFIQVLLTGSWLVLNVVAQTNHWDNYPFLLLNLVITFENALWASLVLMALNRSAGRDRLRAQQDYEQQVKFEEEMRTLMNHLEAQDELLLQVVQRLDRNDRELRRLARRMGLGEERVGQHG